VTSESLQPLAAARAARRQQDKHDGVGGFRRSGARDSRLQPDGTVRRPTPAMMDSFDVLLVDLQDVGCRIIPSSRPFSTCSKRRLGTENRSGCSIGRIRSDRPVEGLLCGRRGRALSARALCPCGMGLRSGACALVHRQGAPRRRLRDCAASGLDARHWPRFRLAAGRARVGQPEPNAPNLWMARCYPGTGPA